MSDKTLSSLFDIANALPALDTNEQFEAMAHLNMVAVFDRDCDIEKIKEALDIISERTRLLKFTLVKKDTRDPANVKFSKLSFMNLDAESPDYNPDEDVYPVQELSVIKHSWDNLDKPPHVDVETMWASQSIQIPAGLSNDQMHEEIERQVDLIRAELVLRRSEQEEKIMNSRKFESGISAFDFYQTLSKAFKDADHSIFLLRGNYKWLPENEDKRIQRHANTFGLPTVLKIIGMSAAEEKMWTGRVESKLPVKADDVLIAMPNEADVNIISPN